MDFTSLPDCIAFDSKSLMISTNASLTLIKLVNAFGLPGCLSSRITVTCKKYGSKIKSLSDAIIFIEILIWFYLTLFPIKIGSVDQSEVCVPYSRLLTVIPMLVVFQNLRWVVFE